MTFYPYADRYDVVRGLPSEGRPRDAILKELREMSEQEDAKWETGKASGSFYCGDHDHYAFMIERLAAVMASTRRRKLRLMTMPPPRPSTRVISKAPMRVVRMSDANWRISSTSRPTIKP